MSTSAPVPVVKRPRWWTCKPCDVTWRSTEPTCWVCGGPAGPEWHGAPTLRSQISPGDAALTLSSRDSPAIL